MLVVPCGNVPRFAPGAHRDASRHTLVFPRVSRVGARFAWAARGVDSGPGVAVVLKLHPGRRHPRAPAEQEATVKSGAERAILATEATFPRAVPDEAVSGRRAPISNVVPALPLRRPEIRGKFLFA